MIGYGRVCAKLFFLFVLLAFSSSSGADGNFVENYNFEENHDGWFTYESASRQERESRLSVSDFESYTGERSLRVQTTGASVLQGPGTNVSVEPGNPYIISAWVRGSGSVMLATNSAKGGWVRGSHTQLNPDRWTRLQIRRYEEGDKITLYIVTYRDQQQVTFYVDNVTVAKEEFPDLKGVEIPPIRYEAQDYAGTSEIMYDDSAGAGAYVMGDRRWDNRLAQGIPFPGTARPVYIYLKGWLGGDEENHFSIVGGDGGPMVRQVFGTEKPSAPEKWEWIKTGPFTAAQLGSKFLVSTGGGAVIDARLDAIVVSTRDDLPESELR